MKFSRAPQVQEYCKIQVRHVFIYHLPVSELTLVVPTGAPARSDYPPATVTFALGLDGAPSADVDPDEYTKFQILNDYSRKVATRLEPER